MSVAASVLTRAGEQLGDFLPRLGAALAVLVLGLLVVRIGGRVLTKLLQRAGVDRLAERLHVHDALVRAGLERSLTRAVVGALRLAAVVAVLVVALSALGLESLDRALNEALLFLPRLLAAVAVVLAGVVLGGLLRERVDRVAFQMALRGPLGTIAQGAAVAVATVIALGQLGVPTGILVVLAAIIAGGAALTAALAFGLGGQAVARELSAGRYVEAGFALGDDITVDGVRGEIVALEASSLVLRDDGGRRFRVPNSRVLGAVVELHGG